MNEYGEKHSAYVLYPQQTSSANSNKCWNWFETGSQGKIIYHTIKFFTIIFFSQLEEKEKQNCLQI